MKTYDIINPVIYTRGHEEQRIKPAALHRSHNLIRTMEAIERENNKICFKIKRSEKQKNLRAEKRRLR